MSLSTSYKHARAIGMHLYPPVLFEKCLVVVVVVVVRQIIPDNYLHWKKVQTIGLNRAQRPHPHDDGQNF